MNEREDYLDRLLRGMDDEEELGANEDFFSSPSSTSQDGEDDFLQAFEKSRSQTGDTMEQGQDNDMDFGIDDIVSNVKSGNLDELDELDGFGSFEDGADLSMEDSLQNFEEDQDNLDEIGTGFGDNTPNFEVNTLDGGGQEDDFMSGEANQELLDMLSGIGDEEPDPFAESDSFEEEFGFSQEDAMDMTEEPEEMGESESLERPQTTEGIDSAVQDLARELEGLGLEMDAASAAETEPPKKKKIEKEKRKGSEGENGEKVGFFKKFSNLMFGGEELIELSEEEAKELDEQESKKAAAEAEEKERKKQQKQEEKDQKKKEKAEKKAQKAQAKKDKPKKEKPPRVIEKTKPLPKLPVFLIMLVCLSLVLLIHLVSNQVGYTLSITQAKEYYDQGEYVEAYSCFDKGSKVKEVDEELYEKSRLTAYIQQPLNSYEVYQKQKMYSEALSALILGVGRYDRNAKEAASVGVSLEYDEMLSKIEKTLTKKYDMTLDQARELYAIREKEEYTLKLYDIIDKLGLE